MKLWIIGSKGLLGSALISLCQQLHIPYVGSSRADLDITDKTAVLAKAQEIQPTHIVNCAAYTDVDKAEKESALAFAVNATGAENAAEAALLTHSKFIHISTNYVFSGTQNKAYREIDPCQPINAYGISKWEGEKKILEIFPSACIIRTSWLFGSRGKNMISSLLDWLKNNELVRVADDQIANLTYCVDLAEMILLARDTQGIHHFANSQEANRYEIALEIHSQAKKLKIPLLCKKIEPVKSATFSTIAKRPLYSALDLTQLKSKPRHWKEAIAEYLSHVH